MSRSLQIEADKIADGQPPFSAFLFQVPLPICEGPIIVLAVVTLQVPLPFKQGSGLGAFARKKVSTSGNKSIICMDDFKNEEIGVTSRKVGDVLTTSLLELDETISRSKMKGHKPVQNEISEPRQSYNEDQVVEPIPSEQREDIEDNMELSSSVPLGGANQKVQDNLEPIKVVDVSSPESTQTRREKVFNLRQQKGELKPSSKLKSPFVDMGRIKKVKSAGDMKIYNFLSRKPNKDEHDLVVEMLGWSLTKRDFYSLKPRGWINSLVITMASKVLVHQEKSESGVVTRHFFNPEFAVDVINDIGQDPSFRQQQWSVDNALKHANPRILGYDILECQMIFVPVCFSNHWFCYVVNMAHKKIDILDSMAKCGDHRHRRLDERMRECLHELFNAVDPSTTLHVEHFGLVLHKIPEQSNSFDCGVYVLKFFELWDGKNMPRFSQKQVGDFRREWMVRFVQHPLNTCSSALLI